MASVTTCTSLAVPSLPMFPGVPLYLAADMLLRLSLYHRLQLMTCVLVSGSLHALLDPAPACTVNDVRTSVMGISAHPARCF